MAVGAEKDESRELIDEGNDSDASSLDPDPEYDPKRIQVLEEKRAPLEHYPKFQRTIASGITVFTSKEDTFTELGKRKDIPDGALVRLTGKGFLSTGVVVAEWDSVDIELGRDLIPPGLEIAVKVMRPGDGNCIVVLRDDQGYGTTGLPPKIPPKADLTYSITIERIGGDLGGGDGAGDGGKGETTEESGGDGGGDGGAKSRSVEAFAQAGRELVADGNLPAAKLAFSDALRRLRERKVATPTEKEGEEAGVDRKEPPVTIVGLLCNLSFVAGKLDDWVEAEKWAREAIAEDKTYGKAHARLSAALAKRGRLGPAKEAAAEAAKCGFTKMEELKAILREEQLEQKRVESEIRKRLAKQFARGGGPNLYGDKPDLPPRTWGDYLIESIDWVADNTCGALDRALDRCCKAMFARSKRKHE